MVLALFHPLAFGTIGQVAPAMVSLGYLAKLWSAGELYGLRQVVFVAWFIAAVAIQVASRDPWTWIAGFVGQVALAIVLVVKDRLSDIV
jgi:hypothetical protein